MYVRQFSGYVVVLTRNCLASTLDYIVMQIRKINREKGYCFCDFFVIGCEFYRDVFSA